MCGWTVWNGVRTNIPVPRPDDKRAKNALLGKVFEKNDQNGVNTKQPARTKTRGTHQPILKLDAAGCSSIFTRRRRFSRRISYKNRCGNFRGSGFVLAQNSSRWSIIKSVQINYKSVEIKKKSVRIK